MLEKSPQSVVVMGGSEHGHPSIVQVFTEGDIDTQPPCSAVQFNTPTI